MAITMFDVLMDIADTDTSALLKNWGARPKFDYDFALSTEVMFESGIEALEQGLLPVPAEVFYVECDVYEKFRVGILVGHDVSERSLRIAGIVSRKSDMSLAGIMDVRVYGDDGVLVGEVHEDLQDEQADQSISLCGTIVLPMCMALQCRDVLVNDCGPSPRIKAKREHRGLPPLDEYKRVTIRPELRAVYDVAAADFHRNGPRLHFRRGHVRNLGSGSKTYVSPCWVGSANLGTITKDYVVKA